MPGKPLKEAVRGISSEGAKYSAEVRRVRQELLRRAGGKGLSVPEMDFAYAFLETLNACEAARRAGYSDVVSSASDCMQNPRVLGFIENELSKIIAKINLTPEAILYQLYHCATRDIADFYDDKGEMINDVRNIPKEARAAIDSIEQTATTDLRGNRTVKTRLKLVPKLVALELAMKYLKLLRPTEAIIGGGGGISWDDLYRIQEQKIEAKMAELRKLEEEANIIDAEVMGERLKEEAAKPVTSEEKKAESVWEE